ncbi:MAG: TspO/MBR family protein [Alphaproteobacteria bacterium]
MKPAYVWSIVWVVVALALNGLIFALGWNTEMQGDLVRPWFMPAGWVVGLVWMVLFALVGFVFGRLRARGDGLQWGVAGLLALCLAYPFYTAGLQEGTVAFWGCVVTLIPTLMLMVALERKDSLSTWMMLPLALWLCFATVLTWTVLGLNAGL